jgi:4-amino-4-deoxy-L-arabinose transferase-like glycosyltransferase
MRSKRADAWRSLEWATLGVGLVAICAVHAPLIGYKSFANVDEAYAGAIAERLLEGFKLYDGAVSQRGPLMYYAYEGIAWLHGWDNIVALRCWALAFALAHLFGVWFLGRTLLRRPAAILATLIAAYALCFGFPAFDGYALHGETLQLPALLGATLLGALAMRIREPRARRLRLFAAGLAYGVATSIKQSVILHPAVLLVWMVIEAHRSRRSLRAFAADVGVLTASTLMVPVAFVLHAWREGTLKELIYYTVTYNREVHLRPAPSHSNPWLPNLFFRLGDGTSFFIVVALLLAVSAPIVTRRIRASWRERSLWPLGRGFTVVHFLALNFAVAVASAASMFRFFPHYFLQAAPFGALCVGACLAPLGRSARWASALRRVAWGWLGFVLFCAWLGTVFGEKVDGQVSYDRTVNDVSRYVRAITHPEDRIFVWGFSPWVYQFSHRRPAGRYVFETYVTGLVPWFWERLPIEHARIVPGSVEALLSDLDREKPAVVVDAGSIMLARPMRAYAPFAIWLHDNYCYDLRVGAFDVYMRKPPPTVIFSSPSGSKESPSPRLSTSFATGGVIGTRQLPRPMGSGSRTSTSIGRAPSESNSAGDALSADVWERGCR